MSRKRELIDNIKLKIKVSYIAIIIMVMTPIIFTIIGVIKDKPGFGVDNEFLRDGQLYFFVLFIAFSILDLSKVFVELLEIKDEED